MPAPHLLNAADLPADFGRYRLLEVLGQGGMARVFLAELQGPAGFRKQVALKVMVPWTGGPGDSPDGLFLREARLGGLLRHPNIVDVYELGEQDRVLFLAMELVRGPSLMQFVRGRGVLSPRATLELGLQLCSALGYAHGLVVDGAMAGLVHRDIKPGNVLLTPEGLAKVADFGIAQVSAWAREPTGRFQGTPSYASPEQIEGRRLDARADIFSLGAVLYLCATGRPLLPGKGVVEVHPQIEAIERRLLAGEGLESADEAVAGLGSVVQQCVRVSPDDRYADAAEVSRDLRHLLRSDLAGPSLADLLLPWGSRDQGSMSVPAIPRPKRAPALPAEPAPATNISAPADAFVGREAELGFLAARIDDHRLVTVRGPAGVGKTRLARELARRRLDRLPGGAWFVDLGEAITATDVLSAVADVLGVDLGGRKDDAVAARLGHALAARGRALLLLDKCEHVGDGVAALDGWLARAPELRVLATSRQPLRRPGEAVFDLGPLVEAEAAELFRRRAGEGDPAAPVAALVERLDHMPLAIELAAGRAAEVGTAGLLDRADEQLDLLRSGGGGRQATLRQAIGWSWTLLADAEQSVLAQLSVFRGGFTLEAATAVVGVPAGAAWGLDLVGSLLDKSLLHRRDGAAGPRLGLYRSIHAFAAERLAESGERLGVELRHGDWFARFGRDEVLDVLDLRPGRALAAALPRERENLKAAFERATSRRDHLTAGRLALARMALALRRGGHREARRDAEAVLRQGADFSDALRLRLLRGAGRLAFLDGDRDRGLRLLEQAMHTAGRLDDRRMQGRLLCDIGELLLQTDRLDEARALLDRSLVLARGIGDRAGEGCSLAALAAAYGEADQIDEALTAFEEAMGIHRAVGNRSAEGRLCTSIGNVLRRRGQLQDAERSYRRALRLLQAAGTPVALATALGNLASVLFLQERYEEAEGLLRAALDTHRRVGGRQSVAIDLSNLAEVLAAQGRCGPARAFIEEALLLAEETGPVGLEGSMLGVLADLLAREGDLAGAIQRLGRAEDLLRQGERRRNELAKVLARKGRILLLAGDVAAAEHAWKEAAAIVHAEGAGPDSEIWRVTAELEAALRGG